MVRTWRYGDGSCDVNPKASGVLPERNEKTPIYRRAAEGVSNQRSEVRGQESGSGVRGCVQGAGGRGFLGTTIALMRDTEPARVQPGSVQRDRNMSGWQSHRSSPAGLSVVADGRQVPAAGVATLTRAGHLLSPRRINCCPSPQPLYPAGPWRPGLPRGDPLVAALMWQSMATYAFAGASGTQNVEPWNLQCRL